MTFEKAIKAYNEQHDLYWSNEEGDHDIGHILGLSGYGESAFIMTSKGLTEWLPIKHCGILSVKPEAPKEPPYKAGDTIKMPIPNQFTYNQYLREISRLREETQLWVEEVFPWMKEYDVHLKHFVGENIFEIEKIVPKEGTDEKCE